MAAAVALVLAGAAATAIVRSGSSTRGRHAGPASTPPVFHFGPGPGAGLPLPLQAAVVAYADAADPLFVMPRSEVSPAVVAVASAALPGSQAVPAGPGGAMVVGAGVHAGRAIYISRTGTITDVGPADVVVPGADNTVGLGSLVGGAETIETVAVTRTVSTLQFVPGPSLLLPAGDLPVAVLGDGRVAVRTEANQLAVDGPGGVGGDLGPLGSVIGVTGPTLAWTAGAGCDPGGACPLHLTDLAIGTTRTVAPPPGTSGFAVGGAFSPDGVTLLAFAVPSSLAGATLATLSPVYVDTSAAAANQVMPGVPTRLVQGVPVGVAWWTADGTWAIYSGLLGTVRSASAEGAVVDLDLPASYSLVVL